MIGCCVCCSHSLRCYKPTPPLTRFLHSPSSPPCYLPPSSLSSSMPSDIFLTLLSSCYRGTGKSCSGSTRLSPSRSSNLPVTGRSLPLLLLPLLLSLLLSSQLMADPLLRTQARSFLLPASALFPQLRSSPVASAKEAWTRAGRTRRQTEETREGRARGDDGPSLQRMSWMLPEEERRGEGEGEGEGEQEGADKEFKAKLEKL